MTADSTDKSKTRPWLAKRPPLGVILLALISYIPLLLTKPGKVGADTKTYLYLDPGRLLSRAPYMWDPNIGLGTVTHQNIGYLWPMGPYYFVMDAIGLPDWVAQRLWAGSILLAAGLGVRWMLRELGWEQSGVTVASLAYALTPYVLEYVARISVILLPFAGLPWLIGLAARSIRRNDWKSPAIFALVTLTVGGVNATSLVLVMVGPVLWLFYATFVLKEVTFTRSLVAGLKISLLTLITSLWWLAGLMIQGTYGIPILRYTETYRTVATAALATELLRGLGYWFFYGQDGLGPWTQSSITYVQAKLAVALSYLLPGLGFLAGLATRWRARLYFALLIVAGLILGVGAHPWNSPTPYGSIYKDWTRSDLGLSFRSTPRAAPLIILGLAVFMGAGVAAVTRARPSLHRPLAAGLLVLICLNMLPLFRGQFVDRNLMRDESVPEYWREAADSLSAGDQSTRALEFPGIDFAAYRWGNTVDPITPGLTDRQFVARELIPYGTPPSANLLNALDAPFQAGRADPDVLAPLARMMGIGDIVFRADLQYERYLTPRPRETWAQLMSAYGLGSPEKFGSTARNEASSQMPIDDSRTYAVPLSAADPPSVSIFPILDSQPILRTVSAKAPLVVAGDGDGLVSVAAAGRLDDSRPVLYSASYAKDKKDLLAQTSVDGAQLVVTDTNRRQARRWGTVRENTGRTEQVGEQAKVWDPSDNRLLMFPDAGDDSMTVTEQLGGAEVGGSGYGNDITYTAGDRPVNAMDDDESTAWRVAAFADARGQFLDATLRSTVTTDHIEILQGQGGKNRWISEVELSFDKGSPIRVALGPESKTSPGQMIKFPKRTFKYLRVTVTATDIGPQGSYKGISDVGIAELRIPGVEPVSEVVIPPRDLLGTVGVKSLRNDLTYLLSRRAGNQADILAADEEPTMRRRLTNPVARSFTAYGKGRVAVNRPDELIDQALGLPQADSGGVTATSSARMPGAAMHRARSAVDGDPTTAYMTPVNAPLQSMTFVYPDKVTIDDLELTVVNTSKFSLPTRVAVSVDGNQMGSFDTAAQTPAGKAGIDSLTKLTFNTGKLTGTSFTIQIEAVEERHSKDWFTGTPTIVPVAVSETNLPSVASPTANVPFDSGCRSDLMTVDDRPVSLRMTGTYGDAMNGGILRVQACGDPVEMADGSTELRTANGADTGFDIDLLGLSSAAGGQPGTDPLAGGEAASNTPHGGSAPQTKTKRTGRLAYEVTVTGASSRYWLVLGQSLSPGWKAVTSTGVDLGEPTLVNGFANGWQIDPTKLGTDVTITLRWTPQRSIWIGLALSAIGVVICLALSLWPKRRLPSDAAHSDGEVDTDPLFDEVSFGSFSLTDPGDPGSGPALGTILIWVAVALACGVFFGGPLVGVTTAVAAAVALTSTVGRWAVRLASLGLYGAAAGFLVLKQALRGPVIDFEWVKNFEVTHSWAIAATFLLLVSVAADVIVERSKHSIDPETSDPEAPSGATQN